ncbi:MobA/MobL family protein, partial [Staphylococcus aureus]|uniref:MobA/MobL family protein n=1 Tax=Staphylococcus aureus TaxID=1280 RepID=UPI0012B3AD33
LPSSLKNQNISIERGELWNKAEKAENRKDARVAREWLVNLPYELDEQQRKELAHNFAQELADRYGVIADCAIHKPTDKEIERGADARNFHAHIMLTTRKAELNDNNEIVLTDKSTAELSDKKRREIKLERMSHEVKEVRQLWERVANEKLAEHGIELIDSRSYKDRQLDIEPQLKMGSVATKKERDKYERELRKAKEAQKKGEHYEIDNTPVTVPGQINAIIKERNELVFNSRKREQKNDRLRTVERATKYIENATNNTVSVNQRVERATQRIDETKRQLERAERAINSTARTATPSPFDEQYRASVNRRKQATARLAEQERRIAEETRRADKQSRYYKYDDKRIAELAENVKLKIAGKLLRRKNDDSRIRWEWHETVEDYPHKYDQRQMQLLDDFEKSIGLDNKDIGFLERVRSFKSMINSEFIEQHKDMIQLINDPEAEREQYNERLTAWFEFKEDIDQKRADFNQSIIPKLGGSAGEVGRMTRDIISSFDYIQGLDQFISDDKQTIEARELAKSHRSDTLNRTCQQFKYAYFDVLKLPSGERESYINALKLTVEEFKNIYGSQLPYEQNKAIDDGLRAFNNDLQRSHRPSKGFSR